jgi:hypothetical protein
MTSRRDVFAAALLVPLVALAGRCTSGAVRPVSAAMETSAAIGKGAARGMMDEYRRRE